MNQFITITQKECAAWFEIHKQKARERKHRRNDTRKYIPFVVSPLWKRCFGGRKEVVK